MPSESSLSRAEKDSLKVERFIFHIVMKGKDDPIYLQEVSLEDNEKDFFRERIAKSAEGTQFKFIDSEDVNSKIKETAAALLEDEVDFVTKSQEITKDFLKYHKTVNTSNGVFVVALVSIVKSGNTVKLLSMIKMDHTRVFQFETEETEEGRKAILRELANTFVEDKKSVQKMALVDASDTFAWDVLGCERSGKDDLAGYFKQFLGVDVREVPSVLTKRTVKVVREWARALSVMPSGENPATYNSRAVKYMQDNDTFEVDSFLNIVVKDAGNLTRKQEMMGALREQLANAGVAGQTFTPRPNSLSNAAKQSSTKTNKEVKIIWSGDPKDRGIEIPESPNENGKYCIRIFADEKPIVE